MGLTASDVVSRFLAKWWMEKYHTNELIFDQNVEEQLQLLQWT